MTSVFIAKPLSSTGFWLISILSLLAMNGIRVFPEVARASGVSWNSAPTKVKWEKNLYIRYNIQN